MDVEYESGKYQIWRSTCIIPHFMMGFSLGSFLLRDYLSRFHDKIAGAVIM